MLNDQLYQKLIFLPYLKSSHGNICLLMCLLCPKVGVGVPCPLTDPYCSSISTQHYKRTPVSFPECVGAVGRLTPPGSLQMFSEPHPGSAPAGLLGQTWLPVHVIRTNTCKVPFQETFCGESPLDSHDQLLPCPHT